MRPGTRLGFFGHMGTQFSMMVFVLLWGVPYLVSAQGLSTAQAGGLMTIFVVCTILIGPVIGMLTMRHPMRRSWLLLGIIAANVTVWTVVLSLSGPAPLWLLVVLVVVLSADGPGSVVGFDIARTSNPSTNLGVAQSMVNIGGLPGHPAGAGHHGDDPDRAGRIHPGGIPGRLAGAVPDLGIRRRRGADHPAQVPQARRRARRRPAPIARGVLARFGKEMFTNFREPLDNGQARAERHSIQG